MDFSLSHSKDVNYPKQGVMVRPCISVMASVEGFALAKTVYAHLAIIM
jgi:hypothetical protein